MAEQAKRNENLTHLMKLMGITGRDLASMLNVHYSLVSKWLNGKRELKQHSDYTRRIVDFLMALDKKNRYTISLRYL